MEEIDQVRWIIYLIVQTVAVVLCLEAQGTVFVVDRSLVTFDAVEEVARVELKA